MVLTLRRRATPLAIFVLTLLTIELLDEITFGVRQAAWPLIRDDLSLTYVQIGILLSAPTLIGSIVKPILGILGDVWKRRLLVIGGGIAFTGALILVGFSREFVLLLVAFILLNPSSGAFVGLSQATLMDYEPKRREHNMARWSFAGSLGQTIGPLLLGAGVLIGLGWRSMFVVLAAVVLGLVFAVRRWTFGAENSESGQSITFAQGVKNALAALKRRDILRWLVLLEFANLMMDVLLGFLALYFVDVVKASPAEAGIAVALWSGIGVLGDLLLIPLLERVRGLSYLRVTAALELVLFAALLLAEPIALKLMLVAILGLFNAGWYSILQGQVYAAMPGQSGTVLSLGNFTGLVGSLIPLAIGLLAQSFGLSVAIWFLLLGPIALLIGLPRAQKMEA